MRSDTPAVAVDILDALLSDERSPSDAAFPGQEALDRLIRRAAHPAAIPKKSRPAAPPATRPVAVPAKIAPKRKVTHYIEQSTRDRLDRARDLLAGTLPGRVTKSGIVEAALGLALEAFEASGPDSDLTARLRATGSARLERKLR